MAAYQIELQAREFVTGNTHLAQLAEARIDAVNRQVIFSRPAHHRARGVHLSDRGRSDLDLYGSIRDGGNFPQRKRLSAE